MQPWQQEFYARSFNTGLEFRDEPLSGTAIEKGFEMAWAVGVLARTNRDDFQNAVGPDVSLKIVNPFDHENLYVHFAKHATTLLHLAGIILHIVEDERCDTTARLSGTPTVRHTARSDAATCAIYKGKNLCLKPQS